MRPHILCRARNTQTSIRNRTKVRAHTFRTAGWVENATRGASSSHVNRLSTRVGKACCCWCLDAYIACTVIVFPLMMAMKILNWKCLLQTCLPANKGNFIVHFSLIASQPSHRHRITTSLLSSVCQDGCFLSTDNYWKFARVYETNSSTKNADISVSIEWIVRTSTFMLEKWIEFFTKELIRRIWMECFYIMNGIRWIWRKSEIYKLTAEVKKLSYKKD